MSSLLILTALLETSLGCLSAGVCGMAGGCGGGYVPPPMPSCGGGCGPGYGCGSYGCYRLATRAHSSKTLRIPEQSDQMRLSPDEKFSHCCQSRHLPDACLTKCSYSTYTKDSIRTMYFKLDTCPSQAAADIHFCAAQGRDHRECCKNAAVGTTFAGQKCLAFCDQRPGQVTQLDLTYLACYHRFDQMLGCFYEDVARGKGATLAAMSLSDISDESNESNDEQFKEINTDQQPKKAQNHQKAKTFRGN
ncbi:unnamed protein product, partial [Mesorhabditis belari]|uniref:Domain of unknown function DB domain-containing protein n=1 Tax=Mesorhabditis belari TaxID=2138241 RepID=A0AAF3FGT5_9BILA